MPKQTDEQKQVVERVMHEFKHGELDTNGRKVRNPKQAIAIALHEAGASDEQSPAQNKASLRRTRSRRQRGDTAQQQEGADALARNRAELYAEAQRRGVSGRSKMNKAQLERALSG